MTQSLDITMNQANKSNAEESPSANFSTESGDLSPNEAMEKCSHISRKSRPEEIFQNLALALFAGWASWGFFEALHELQRLQTLLLTSGQPNATMAAGMMSLSNTQVMAWMAALVSGTYMLLAILALLDSASQPEEGTTA